MTAEEKITLLKEVLDEAYDASDSWEEQPATDRRPDDGGALGVDLIYLVHAILADSDVHWGARHSARMFCQETFGAGHAVFEFINYLPDATAE